MTLLRAILLAVFLIGVGCAGVLFLSPWGHDTRANLWEFFDRDTVYAVDGAVIDGWIWGDSTEYIAGKGIDGRFFNVRAADCTRVERNRFLELLHLLI